MAEPEKKDYSKKKFVDLADQSRYDALVSFISDAQQRYPGNSFTVSNLANYKSTQGGFNRAASEYAAVLQNLGLGDLQITDVANKIKNDPDFLSKYEQLGKSYSYSDLAKEAMAGDPNFDPADENALNALSEQIEKRGLTSKDKEEIRNLSTNLSIKDQIGRATNPGKYLSEEQRAANLETANRLLGQNMGADFSDPDLADFLSQRLAEGESAFELSQFLQTTPTYMKKQADTESARVKEESAAARQALDAELLKSEEQAFARATPNIISSYMRAGRLNSSGLNSALAKARGELANERQGFLANAAYQDAARSQGYRREDFVGAQNQAFGQYLRQNEPAYQQRFALQGAQNQLAFQQPYNQLNRFYGLQDQARQRANELQDYDRQQSDYERYLSQYRKQSRENALYGLAGNVLGAGASAGLGKLFG